MVGIDVIVGTIDVDGTRDEEGLLLYAKVVRSGRRGGASGHMEGIKGQGKGPGKGNRMNRDGLLTKPHTHY